VRTASARLPGCRWESAAGAMQQVPPAAERRASALQIGSPSESAEASPDPELPTGAGAPPTWIPAAPRRRDERRGCCPPERQGAGARPTSTPVAPRRRDERRRCCPPERQGAGARPTSTPAAPRRRDERQRCCPPARQGASARLTWTPAARRRRGARRTWTPAAPRRRGARRTPEHRVVGEWPRRSAPRAASSRGLPVAAGSPRQAVSPLRRAAPAARRWARRSPAARRERWQEQPAPRQRPEHRASTRARCRARRSTVHLRSPARQEAALQELLAAGGSTPPGSSRARRAGGGSPPPSLALREAAEARAVGPSRCREGSPSVRNGLRPREDWRPHRA
jgi:hypothetical protein